MRPHNPLPPAPGETLTVLVDLISAAAGFTAILVFAVLAAVAWGG